MTGGYSILKTFSVKVINKFYGTFSKKITDFVVKQVFSHTEALWIFVEARSTLVTRPADKVPLADALPRHVAVICLSPDSTASAS